VEAALLLQQNRSGVNDSIAVDARPHSHYAGNLAASEQSDWNEMRAAATESSCRAREKRVTDEIKRGRTYEWIFSRGE
jgi:hypothetical protein